MEKILESCKMIGGIVTVENAEAYYKKHYGNVVHNIDGSDIKFYMQHFTKEDFLKWNEDIVKRMIEKYKENDKVIYTDEVEGWKHFYDLAWIVYMIYVEDKDIYRQRIELLKKLYKDYGYFMNYYCGYGLDTEFYQDIFVYYFCDDPNVMKYSSPSYDASIYPTNSFFYDPSRIRTGLIPDLYYLGYYDLLDEYLEECFLPISLNYGEEGKYFKLYNMNYMYSKDEVRTASNIIEAVAFLRSKGYNKPKELYEFWEEKNIYWKKYLKIIK